MALDRAVEVDQVQPFAAGIGERLGLGARLDRLAGLELVEPGVVSLPRWRPDPAGGDGPPREVDAVGGVGRKP
jgi:hypothetical protein